jgi:sugar/nucleoside kinase (ribokinase family)
MRSMAGSVDFAFVGGLRQDYCITHDGRVFAGMLGGNALYAAVGARVWGASVGVVSRVGSDFPSAWLERLRDEGFNLDGVRVLPDPQDTRTFYAYLSPDERVDTSPSSHFLRVGHALPKELLGYQHSTLQQDRRASPGRLAVRVDDLPAWIDGAQGVHFSPGDYLTHLTVPTHLRHLGIKRLTLDPSLMYMDPGFRRELPDLLNGLDAFLPSRMEAEAFFRPQRLRVWEMAEAFLGMGCAIVVIKCGANGQAVLDGTSGKRWDIPAYPVQPRDVTGAGDAYCGGFLAGLAQTGDPLEAALRGSVSSSLVIEGTGALFALATLPGLPLARLHALRQAVGQA